MINQDMQAFALEHGFKRFIGTPCKVCGTNLRYTVGTACCECAVKHQRAYRARNVKKLSDYRRSRYLNKCEKARQQRKAA